jgi:uncharacterized protein (TIGR04222 family)
VVVYLLVLIVVALGVLAVRFRMVGGRPRRGVPTLAPHETAMLAGGPARVALTVLSDMVDDGRLTVDDRGRVGVLPTGDAVVDPLRQAVLRGFQDRPLVRASILLGRAARQPEMRVSEQSAIRRGLLFDRGRRRRIRLVPLPLILASLAGVPLIVVQIAHDPAIAVLVPFVVVVLVSSIALAVSTPRCTPLGREVVRRAARAHRRRDRRVPIVVDGSAYPFASFDVAARGGVAVPDPKLSDALLGGNAGPG